MEKFQIPFSHETNELAEDIQETFHSPDSPTGRPDDEQALKAAQEMMTLRHEILEQGGQDD